MYSQMFQKTIIYLYVHVCVYILMYMCVYVFAHMYYVHSCINGRVHTCVCSYMCVFVHMCVYTQREKGKANEAKYKQLVKRSKRYTDRNPLYSSYNTPVNLILYQNQKLKNI